MVSPKFWDNVNKLYLILGIFVSILIITQFYDLFVSNNTFSENILEEPNQPTIIEDASSLSENEINSHSIHPDSLIHFWQEGSLLWSCGIWGSGNLLNFTTDIAEVDTDHPEFGEFMIWIDPTKANAVPGHGYTDNVRFWSLDQKGAGLSSQEIIIGHKAIINLKPNTGRYGLGNPQ